MSHFAKRHYEAIATVLQETFPPDCEANAVLQWRAIRTELIALFSRDNPKFDCQRFERACLPGTNVQARG